MEKFETLKTEILKRAKEQSACKEQYARALKSNTYQELLQVVKDNFSWAATHKIIDADLIGEYKQVFNDNDIWCNESVSIGFLLATGSATVEATGSATVRAYDRATVEATGSATVRAYDRATVRAYGSATVRATGSATVEATGSATVRAYDRATVRAYDSATVRAYGSATVRAYGSATVEAYDSATVRAYDSSYCISFSTIECKLSKNAILRIIPTNTIYTATDSELSFKEQPTTTI